VAAAGAPDVVAAHGPVAGGIAPASRAARLAGGPATPRTAQRAGRRLEITLPGGETFAELLAAITQRRCIASPDSPTWCSAPWRAAGPAEAAGLVGCLVNTLPVRIAVTGSDTLGDLQGRVCETLLEVPGPP
jgi:hypothetical protein